MNTQTDNTKNSTTCVARVVFTWFNDRKISSSTTNKQLDIRRQNLDCVGTFSVFAGLDFFASGSDAGQKF